VHLVNQLPTYKRHHISNTWLTSLHLYVSTTSHIHALQATTQTGLSTPYFWVLDDKNQGPNLLCQRYVAKRQSRKYKKWIQEEYPTCSYVSLCKMSSPPARILRVESAVISSLTSQWSNPAATSTAAQRTSQDSVIQSVNQNIPCKMGLIQTNEFHTSKVDSCVNPLFKW
jgi:hypothetical protein